jgi:hypothetical protein
MSSDAASGLVRCGGLGLVIFFCVSCSALPLFRFSVLFFPSGAEAKVPAAVAEIASDRVGADGTAATG